MCDTMNFLFGVYEKLLYALTRFPVGIEGTRLPQEERTALLPKDARARIDQLMGRYRFLPFLSAYLESAPEWRCLLCLPFWENVRK